MTSESDDWLGSWTLDAQGNVVLVDDGPETQDGDDKHSLAATSGVGEWHYDVLDGDGVYGYDPGWDTVLPMFGSHNNHGLWYDRDGVDLWQADDWINTGINAPRINTGGLYHIEITYHAIDPGLGVMFARVNGSVMQGFYTSGWDVPQLYPAGLSFKGDMKQMQVFAGSFAYDPAGHDYGTVTLSDIQVNGVLGTADPLVADFTYSPTTVSTGDTVQFTDASHGGMPDPSTGIYTYSWDFGDGSTSILQNPTHTYTGEDTYTVTLTLTPFRCVPKTVTKTITVVCPAYLNVIKFYDANANGENDDGQEITGWPINIAGTPSSTPVSSLKLPSGTYTVSESRGGPWMGTTPASVEVTLGCGETKSVAFGNLCLGAGGGLTPGFWSNKNGQALVGLDDLNMLRGLNLRTKAGGDFNPSRYSRLKSWLLKADATNMAYMLSVHLAAMELNVYNGKVTGGALIYAPGTTSANALGFATVTAVMAEANIELGFHELTPAGNEYRAYQEALKNALDKANNNKTFVRPTPCTF